MKHKLLKQKNFTLLMLGKLVSLLGSNIQQFALSLYVLDRTGSATIFASMLAISILPRLLLSPIAGVFGDWFDRKKTIIILDITNAVLITCFASIIFFSGNLSLIMIYILVILLEAVEIFFQSAMSTILPNIVKKEELLEANSINSVVINIGNLLAPIIAAIIYSSFNIFIIFIINSISFLLSAISEIFIKINKSNKKPDKITLKAFKTDLLEGYKTIKNNKSISTIIKVAMIINFCVSPLFSVCLIFVIKEILEASNIQYGIFQVTIALPLIITPMFVSIFVKKLPIGKLCFLSFLTISLIILTMAFIPSNIILNSFESNLIPYILILILAFLIGVFVTIANITISTMFNKIIPLELMARTSAVLSLGVTILIPVGQITFGYLIDTINISYTILISGTILMLTTIKHRNSLFRINTNDNNDRKIAQEMI